MVDQMTAMERVANTPIPASCKYSILTCITLRPFFIETLLDGIHLKQVITLYLFALPFTLAGELGWASIPIVTVISFTFMGIEGIADEIEMPFGEL
jgi:ion channel-forming bestrophin family protein